MRSVWKAWLLVVIAKVQAVLCVMLRVARWLCEADDRALQRIELLWPRTSALLELHATVTWVAFRAALTVCIWLQLIVANLLRLAGVAKPRYGLTVGDRVRRKGTALVGVVVAHMPRPEGWVVVYCPGRYVRTGPASEWERA